MTKHEAKGNIKKKKKKRPLLDEQSALDYSYLCTV